MADQNEPEARVLAQDSRQRPQQVDDPLFLDESADEEQKPRGMAAFDGIVVRRLSKEVDPHAHWLEPCPGRAAGESFQGVAHVTAVSEDGVGAVEHEFREPGAEGQLLQEVDVAGVDMQDVQESAPGAAGQGGAQALPWQALGREIRRQPRELRPPSIA